MVIALVVERNSCPVSCDGASCKTGSAGSGLKFVVVRVIGTALVLVEVVSEVSLDAKAISGVDIPSVEFVVPSVVAVEDVLVLVVEVVVVVLVNRAVTHTSM